jgi:hypothetical protein
MFDLAVGRDRHPAEAGRNDRFSASTSQVLRREEEGTGSGGSFAERLRRVL